MNTFAFAEEVADVDSFAEEISFADVEKVPGAKIKAPLEDDTAGGWDVDVESLSVDYVEDKNTFTIEGFNLTSESQESQSIYFDIDGDSDEIKDETTIDSKVEIKEDTVVSYNFVDDEGDEQTVSANVDKYAVHVNVDGWDQSTKTVKISSKIAEKLILVEGDDYTTVTPLGLDDKKEYFVFKIVSDFDDDLTSETEWNPTVSADLLLSQNAAEISENLAEKVGYQVGTSNYFVVYPRAIAFDGKNKPGSKKAGEINVEVYEGKTTTVSAGDLISENEAETDMTKKYTVNTTSFNKLAVKKIKIKAAKGATVDIKGAPLDVVKKSTYISSIKLEDKAKNKEFAAASKEIFKAIKKDKTSKVSANGVKENSKDEYKLVIAVYPCYAGNDATAQAIAKLAGLKQLGSIDTSKYAKKKITGTDATTSKKVTLKPTKKTGKFKGYNTQEVTVAANTNSLGATKYVAADGNFCGNIYIK